MAYLGFVGNKLGRAGGVDVHLNHRDGEVSASIRVKPRVPVQGLADIPAAQTHEHAHAHSTDE